MRRGAEERFGGPAEVCVALRGDGGSAPGDGRRGGGAARAGGPGGRTRDPAQPNGFGFGVLSVDGGRIGSLKSG